MDSLSRKILQPNWLVLVVCLLLPWPGAAAETYRFAGVERVVAVGDSHGAFDEFVTILQGTGLVDEKLSWRGDRTHLVSVGDLLGRGDYGRQVMDLMMRLQEEADAAGGAVHVVLGNHEVMNLVGDLRYVSDGDYAQFGAETRRGLPAGYHARRAAFAPDGEYGRWLLGLPVAIIVNDSLFLHGGISARLEGLSLATLNDAARRDVRTVATAWHELRALGEFSDTDDFGAILARAPRLAQSGDPSVRQLGLELIAALDGLPFTPDGPLWYRGSVRCHPLAETAVAERVLASLGARRVVVGHTPTHERHITSRLDGRVISIDTGMNRAAYQGESAALLIEQGELTAWIAGTGQVVIGTEPNRIWERPHGLSNAEIERFLLTAEVAAVEPLDDAGPARRRVTLAQGDRQLRATFNTVDAAPRLREGRWSRHGDGAERYSNQIAAYRLDQLLALDMVPVTVEREIDGERGALRLWIEDSFSEAERQAGGRSPRSDCPLPTQFNLVAVFDLLIFNAEHDFASLRYDRYGQLWLLDQLQAFGLKRDLGAMLRRAELDISPQLAAALAGVTEERAAALLPYLHPRQVQALVTRAAQLRASH